MAKVLDFKFTKHEKQDILTWSNALLRQFKSYIENKVNPEKNKWARRKQNQIYSASDYQINSRWMRDF